MMEGQVGQGKGKELTVVETGRDQNHTGKIPGGLKELSKRAHFPR